ncbi:MAG: peptidoglycan-binding domain-containing protein [Solirubrobacteraceae bacterium]
MAVMLLIPAQGVAAKKNSRSGDRTPREGAKAQGVAAKKNSRLGARSLGEGDKGQDVRVLQSFLTRAGVRTGVDGVFGRGTTKSVRAFERSQLRRVDGRVSRLDVFVLRDVVQNGGAVAKAAGTGGALPKNGPAPKIVPVTPVAPPPLKVGPGMTATVGPDGLAVAPVLAPPVVRQVIAAGNKIAKMRYIYGGGHGKWEDAGYDCSGSVSYALHGAGLLETSMASGGFMSWADTGPGRWITTYANGGHMYMVVAGLRFDTSGRASAGTRWQAEMRPTRGYEVRHPPGL